ncbi:MAG: hypothetical protein L0212_07985 [Acidobacteria bacterium]|nr:hypothetical protein [Acidobacteriota bacterium]
MRGTVRMAVAVALLALLVGLMAPSESEAQAAKPAAKAAAAPAKPPVQRRDPFRSLLAAAGGAGGAASCPSPGKAGLMIGQLSIVGIVITPNDSVAVANMAGRNRAYFLRERDELCDGYVSRITPENVSFREKAKDAYGRAYEKEVVKQLTAGSGAKR